MTTLKRFHIITLIIGRRVYERINSNCRYDIINMMINYKKVKISVGDFFGRWEVISQKIGKVKGYKAITCRCSCEKETIRERPISRLVRGLSKSCGCVRYDGTSCENLGDRTRVHGGTASRLYNIWKNMKQRCYNINDSQYKYYGEKGIKLSEQWKNDFLKFKDWAINNGYNDSLSIDRLDVNLGYYPENCEWVTVQENSRRASEYHLTRSSGFHSKRSNKKSKDSNIRNNGIKCVLLEDKNKIHFPSVSCLADYLAKILDRNYKSVYSQCKQVLNSKNKCKTIGGFKIEKI